MNNDNAAGPLLPCPFCGGQSSPDGLATYSGKHSAFFADGSRVTKAFFCNCVRCGVTNKGLLGHQTKDAAIAAWNRRATRWIPVAEKLPDDDMTVLIVMDDGEVWTGYMDGDAWRYVSGDTMSAAVTYWAHMPEPPKQEKKP